MGNRNPDRSEGSSSRDRSGGDNHGITVSELIRWSIEHGLLSVKTPEAGRSLAALWTFLYFYRESCPEILGELVETVLPVHVQERSGARLQPQLADWWNSYGLPRTKAMHREVVNTLDLSAHTLEREEPRWAFEWVIANGKSLFGLETESNPSLIVTKEPGEDWPTWEPKLEVPAGLTIPYPPETDEPVAWKRWRARAGRELVAQFEALWTYTSKAVDDFSGSAPRALSAFERDEPKRLRDLKWLAMKQAGLSAAEIADRDGPEQGISEEGVWKALRRAADEIGLAHELIRHARPGRKPAS